MWTIESTTRLLKEMSQSTDAGDVVRLFFDHVRQNIDVHRALVLSRAGLSAPDYRLVHSVNGDGVDLIGSVDGINALRQGGLLAEILYRGELQNITHLAPDASDPAFDLLQGSGSLIAFPLFDKGINTGVVVMLGDSLHAYDTANLCALATMSSLLGRAIEAQNVANQLEEACHALDSELKAAANVQRWLLPSLPHLDNVSIAASYRTARYSSGDYYDVGLLPDGRLGVFIADVSGKGAAAAVLMAVLRSIVHDEVDSAGSSEPAALLDYADSRLRALGLTQRAAFVTAFCGVIDPATGLLIYSCAGHNPPRVLRAQDRTVCSLDGARTFPLGLTDEPHNHTEETVVLMPGDLALFYTDGITEARSPAGDFFGVERLDHILRNLPDPITVDAAVEDIARAVESFEAHAMPLDDQTLVALGGCPTLR
jgi:sigma-B regulation protein RsbU (phosphoserine phosphatase)